MQPNNLVRHGCKTSLGPKSADPCQFPTTPDGTEHSGSRVGRAFGCELEPFTATVPTTAERAGDFSAIDTTLADPCAGAVNSLGACPGSTATPTTFPGNFIPPNRVSPTSKALLDLWPAANSAGVVTPSGTINNFNTVARTGGDQNQVVARVDQDLTRLQRLLVRFSYWNALDLPVDPLENGVCADRCSEKYST